MEDWFKTFVETEHFPFYEFLWLCMLGLWWSVIARLKRIEEHTKEHIDDLESLIAYFTGEEK